MVASVLARNFASEKLLAWFNVAAVASILAACTASIAGLSTLTSGWAVGVPTLIFGALWAVLLRHPSTVPRTSIRWSWFLSIPLAAVNGGLCFAGAAFARPPADIIGPAAGMPVINFVAGATVGVIVWAPALVLSFACFGAPTLWAQHLAKKGLAGKDRGERIVGAVCVGLGLIALVLACVPPLGHVLPFPFGLTSGRVFAGTLAVMGMLLGGLAAALASVREHRRADFIARVEAGQVEHFRVQPTRDGKVLLRVERGGEGTYRVASYEEEICRLDDEGRAIELRPAATLEDDH